MADLLERVTAAARAAPAGRDGQRFSIDTWISDYLLPSSGLLPFAGNTYGYGFSQLGLTQTLAGNKVQEFTQTLPGHTAALTASPPAFAAQMVRSLVLSQVRFTFRNPPWHPRTPRRTFGTGELGLLERPWPNATTGELVARMQWHEGLAGNSFVAARAIPRTPLAPLGRRLRVLRPDWCALVYGSEQDPDEAAHALDGELLGLIYQNGGLGAGRSTPVTLLPGEFAHWSPNPDPLNAGLGMSWLTPAIREIQGDVAATVHKIKFFEQGATPNLVVRGLPYTQGQEAAFQRTVAMLEEQHAGLANAYKTLYLSAGSDATVVGANLNDLDLKQVQGGYETRISMLSRVHPVILGIAEGLAGSALNAGNFGMARRIWADGWIYPTLQDLAAALAPLVTVPADAELWFDTADMPILREDAKDAAEIEQIKASTIRQLVDGGFKPDSVIAAVQGQNMDLLTHSGMLSVQLQKPGDAAPSASGAEVGDQGA